MKRKKKKWEGNLLGLVLPSRSKESPKAVRLVLRTIQLRPPLNKSELLRKVHAIFFFAFQNRCEREENTKTGSLMSPPFVLFFNWNSPFRNVWYWITLVAKMRELECGRQVLKKEKKQKKKEGWVENFCQRSKTIRQITGACYISHWISTMRVRGQTKLESQEKSKTLLHIGRWKWVVRSIVSFADPSSILLAC